MRFRIKAFGLHLLGSACAMSLLLGGLYAGWYHWPGWYLAGATSIALMVAGFDVVLGPLLTLVIANPSKPRRELQRDIAIIICVQLVAAAYGATTLWNGRVLYYTSSEKWLQIVQASDLDSEQISLARQENPKLAPYWYSVVRWVYAELPSDDPKLRQNIAEGRSIDVIQMPRYFRPWEAGSAKVRQDLRALDSMGEFSPAERAVLKGKLADMGIAADAKVGIPLMGRGRPLFVVFDPASMQIKGMLRAN